MRCLAVALLLAAAALAEQVEIKGRVLDKEGKPVADADIAKFWSSRRDGMHPYNGVKTDANGRFSITVQFYNRPVAITVLDRQRKRGVIGRYDKDTITQERELTLEPLVRVKGHFRSEDLGRAIPWTNVYFNAMPGRIRAASCISSKAEFTCLLPPGDYELYMYGTDVKRVLRNITVEADTAELDLKTINLPATIVAKHYGKAPPSWNVTDARGTKKDVTVADYKGKWLLIEFWGFW